MTKGTWPYDAIFGERKENEILKRHVIYKRKAGTAIGSYDVEITTITRQYYGVDDYQDSVTTEIVKTAPSG